MVITNRELIKPKIKPSITIPHKPPQTTQTPGAVPASINPSSQIVQARSYSHSAVENQRVDNDNARNVWIAELETSTVTDLEVPVEHTDWRRWPSKLQGGRGFLFTFIFRPMNKEPPDWYKGDCCR